MAAIRKPFQEDLASRLHCMGRLQQLANASLSQICAISAPSSGTHQSGLMLPLCGCKSYSGFDSIGAARWSCVLVHICTLSPSYSLMPSRRDTSSLGPSLAYARNSYCVKCRLGGSVPMIMRESRERILRVFFHFRLTIIVVELFDYSKS